MKYWLDTEFIAKPYTIDLISIGLVAEDGRELYAESSEADWSKASRWTLDNVRPRLEGKGRTREEIGCGLREFTDGDERPAFWGYFPAYNWVSFVWLFGGLGELPFHYPQLCLDVKQWTIELGDPELPHQQGAPSRAPRRPLDARRLGVSRPPRSRRGRAPRCRAQEPRRVWRAASVAGRPNRIRTLTAAEGHVGRRQQAPNRAQAYRRTFVPGLWSRFTDPAGPVSDLLEFMRATPAADWRIADVERVCRQFNIRCVPPSSGSHYKISHPSQKEILTVPFRRPIKPVYIRKLVRFIDAVRSDHEKA